MRQADRQVPKIDSRSRPDRKPNLLLQLALPFGPVGCHALIIGHGPSGCGAIGSIGCQAFRVARYSTGTAGMRETGSKRRRLLARTQGVANWRRPRRLRLPNLVKGDSTGVIFQIVSAGRWVAFMLETGTTASFGTA